MAESAKKDEATDRAERAGRREAEADAVAAERDRVLGFVRSVLLGQPVPHSLTAACAEIERRANG